MLWRKVRNWFLAGLVVLLPVWLSLFTVFWLFDSLDRVIAAPIQNSFGWKLPGLGIVLAVVVILFAGWLTTHFIGQKMIRGAERALLRIPLVRALYAAVKQVTDTLFSPKGQAFSKVVLAEFPRIGVYSLGFVAGEVPGSDLVRVWLPPGPSPTAGPVVMLPARQLVYLPMSVEDGLKFVVSAGVLLGKESDVAAVAAAAQELARRRGDQ